MNLLSMTMNDTMTNNVHNEHAGKSPTHRMY
jgi:hypothetical protein